MSSSLPLRSHAGRFLLPPPFPDCLVVGAGCGGRVWEFDANLTVPPLAGGSLELAMGAVTFLEGLTTAVLFLAVTAFGRLLLDLRLLVDDCRLVLEDLEVLKLESDLGLVRLLVPLVTTELFRLDSDTFLVRVPEHAVFLVE